MEIGDVVKVNGIDRPALFFKNNDDDVDASMLVVRLLDGNRAECCWVHEKGVVKYRTFNQDCLVVYDLND